MSEFKFLHTTAVPVTKTAGEVMAILGKMGATNIAMEMEGGEPSGMTFATVQGERRACYRLPVRWQPVYAAMLKESDRGRRSRWESDGQKQARRAKIEAQAKRTAWRISSEWLKVQCAFVSHGIKTAQEVFLCDQLIARPGLPPITLGEFIQSPQGVTLLEGPRDA